MGQGVLTDRLTARRALLADADLEYGPGGQLCGSGVDLASIAHAVGTPAFAYLAEPIRRRYRAFSEAFAEIPHRIHYAVKANGNLAVLRLLRELGAGVDIVSRGELARCLAAGFPAGRIVFSGVGKTPLELDEAVAAGIGCIHVESLEELEVLAGLSCPDQPIRIGIRVNPDVTTDTHPHISTGHAGIKFGIPTDLIDEAAGIIRGAPGLLLTTIASHLGSQLLDVSPIAEASATITALASRLRAEGVGPIEAVDLGGGLGIRYSTEQPPEPSQLAAAVIPIVKSAGFALHLEPGRALVGSAGVLLTRVLYRKRAGGKTFVVVDAGMTELARPSKYGAHHEVVEVVPRAGAEEECDLVGPICETGDFLALGRELPPVEPGDLLAILGCGAYGFVMGSNYNARPRPPEVLIDQGRWAVARPRESIAALMEGETADPFALGELS